MRARSLVRLAAAATALASVLAAGATTTPDRSDPFHQAGFARQVVHERPVAEGDFKDVEHVANIDLSVFQALAVDENGNPWSDDSGMGTFLDFASFEVEGEGLRDFAFLGTDYDGTFIIDITTPAEPVLRGHIPCRYEQNEVVFVNGLDRPVIAIGNQEGPSCAPEDAIQRFDVENATVGFGSGQQFAELISVWDISDPDEPTFLSAYGDDHTGGTHTLAAHPTEPVVIPVGGSQVRLQFVDLSDPTAPSVLAHVDTPGTTHAVHFSPDGTRLATAGGLVEAVSVIDTSDLANPVLEAVATVPGQTYAHEVHPFTQVDAVTGEEVQYHIASEENLIGNPGAILGARYDGVCSSTGFFVFRQDGPVMTPLSFATAGFAPGTPTGGNLCTGHYGSVSHDGGAYVVPWYIAGLYVFDLSNPLLPVEVAHAILPDANLWSAKTYRGNWIYAGDLNRGFDVYRYTGDLDLAEVPEPGDEGA